jgi:hypothetical protein
MVEEWRWVPGFERRYEVSNLGQVRSYMQPGRWGKLLSEPRLLKPVVDPQTGYPRVQLGRGVRRAIHSLVAEAFIGPRPEGRQVRHLDGNRGNPHLVNLAYGTQAENEEDKNLHGTRARGEAVHNALLTDELVREMRRLSSEGVIRREIAARLGVSFASVSNVLKGQTWRHVA